MTVDEFAIIVKAMKAMYNNEKFIADKDAFDLWYSFLGGLDYAAVQTAVKKHIMTSPYVPTVKDILDNLPHEELASELESWALLRKGLRNSIYNAETEFAKLPENVRMAIGSPETMREWAMIPSTEVETVCQSNFLRTLATVNKRIKQNRILNITGEQNEQSFLIGKTD